MELIDDVDVNTIPGGCVNQIVVVNTKPNGSIDINTKLCGCVTQIFASNTELDGCVDVNTNPVFIKHMSPFSKISMILHTTYFYIQTTPYGSNILFLLFSY